MAQIPQISLSDGQSIPQIGFGTWQVSDDDAHSSVLEALRVGYRHIDTAAIYGNEAGVGRAIAESGIARDELYVTTKLWNDQHKRADARRGIEESLEKLGLDRLDLYLIHWPSVIKHGDEYIEAWDAMQEFKAEGLVTSIGVSNFHPEHLDRLNGETPVIDQVEIHPTLPQDELRAELDRRGIKVESWSPLGSGDDLGNESIAKVAESLGKSVAQVIIRWHLEKGLIVLPKSVTPSRIAENFDVFDFELGAENTAIMDGLDSNNRRGAHPAEADF